MTEDEHTIADTVAEIRTIRLADMEPKFYEIKVTISKEWWKGKMEGVMENPQFYKFLNEDVGRKVVNAFENGETEVIID